MAGVVGSLDPDILKRLNKTRVWARAGKSSLYRDAGRFTRIGAFFALKRAYRQVQRVPVVGKAATFGAFGARRVLSKASRMRSRVR